MNCDSLSNQLKVSKLCASKVKAECVCSDRLVAKSACITALQATTANIQTEVVNDLCAVNANINNLCVQNLTATNQVNCVKWRAAATMAAPTVYTLGANINWNVILDDPNTSTTMSPFTYTVPVSGYYIVKMHLNVSGLTTTTPLTGIPVGLLAFTVNGNVLVDSQSVYLSFNAAETSGLDALVLLNAGDVLQMNYQVLALNASTGLVSLAGTVVIGGNGLLPGQSFFTVHYLSSLNCTPGNGATCKPCIPVAPIVCDCDTMCMEPGAASCRSC
jgi:hypothetical protein